MKNLLIIGLVVIIGSIYLSTLTPGVTPEDSGEIATASFSIGVPHPPGYPLYVITAKLFTFLPVKNIIYRTNLFSLFFGILTCLVLIGIVHSFTSNYLLAILTSLLFGFSRTFWSQSIVTEVYTFNLFLVSLFILYTLKSLKNFEFIKFNFFLTGLLVVSHYSNFLLILPVWLCLIFKYKKELLKWNNLLLSLLPLTLFFVLMIRSNSNPLIDWGNPENFHNFIIHILRLSFGSMISKTPRTLTNIYLQFKMFLKMYSLQFGLIPGILILVFAIVGLKNLVKPYKIMFILLLFFTSIGTIILLNFKVDEESFYINRVFFLQFYLVLSIIAGYGISNYKKLGTVIFSSLIVITIITNYKYNNRSDDNFTLQYNKNLLKSSAYNATIFVAKDFVTFPLLYLNKIEYLRPDLKIYDWFGNVFKVLFQRKDFHLIPEFKRDAIREKITDRIRVSNKNETYYAFQRDTLNNTKCLGLIYTFNKSHPDFDINYYDSPEIPTPCIYYMDYFVKNMISVYYFHLGYYYKQAGDEKKSETLFNISNKFGGNKAKHLVNLAINEMKQNNIETAINYLKQAILEDSSIDRPYFILGNIYFQKADYLNAERMYIECLRLNKFNGPAYNNLANLYLKSGKKKEAKQIFKQGLFTGYGKLFNNLALILSSEGDYSAAEKYLNQGIKVDPENIELYLNLSVLLSRQNRWEQSEGWLEKAIKIAPDNKNVLLNLALVYIKLNKFDKAKILLQKGAQKYPNDSNFKKYLNIL